MARIEGSLRRLELPASPRRPAAGLSTVRPRSEGYAAPRKQRYPQRWKVTSIILFLLIPSPLLLPANNCGCDSTASWESAFSKANVVILATCMDVSPNAIKGGLNVVFQVDSSWKREIERVATVHTNSPQQCGYPFQRGHRYIVFANKRHQTVETSVCEPNQAFEENGALTLRRLGEGYAPGREGFAQGMNTILIMLVVLGLLFLGVVVLRKRLRQLRHGE